MAEYLGSRLDSKSERMVADKRSADIRNSTGAAGARFNDREVIRTVNRMDPSTDYRGKAVRTGRRSKGGVRY